MSLAAFATGYMVIGAVFGIARDWRILDPRTLAKELETEPETPLMWALIAALNIVMAAIVFAIWPHSLLQALRGRS